MRPHLEYTSDEYAQEADARGVRPISEIDCEIIEVLHNMFMKGEPTQIPLGVILGGWKHNSDEQTLNEITDYSNGIISVVVPDEDLDEHFAKLHHAYIKIKEYTFKVMKIYSIGPEDAYEGDRPIYNIVINKGPLPANRSWYENTRIKCYTLEEREELIKVLETKLNSIHLCKYI